jgi:uncharacterized protein YpbB
MEELAKVRAEMRALFDEMLHPSEFHGRNWYHVTSMRYRELRERERQLLESLMGQGG